MTFWILFSSSVCADINIQCNKCSICTDSKSASHEIQIRNHCSHRKCLGIRMMDGCFANYVRLPASNLHFVPENISDAVAVFAEPLASALRPLEQRLISERDKTAIVGDGKLGLLLGEVLVLRLRLVGLSDEEIENKVNLLGHHPKRGFIDQTQCVMSNHGDTVPYHKTEVGYRFFNNQDNSTLSKVLQEQFDVVIEASGSSSGLFLAAQLATPQGRIILKTTIATTSIKIEDLKSLEMIVVKEINLCGSRCGSIQDALSILSGKTVPDYIHNLPASTIPCEALKSLNVEKYISHVFTLSDGLTAFEEASRRGTMKVQLIIESR